MCSFGCRITSLRALSATYNHPSGPNDSASGQRISLERNNVSGLLSAPTTNAKYPEVMRTRAWGHKTLNTQLASWAELRHDTILYSTSVT